MIDFSNKIALVTGGTRGIGKSIVDLLVDLGCDVVYTGTKEKDVSGKNKKRYFQLDFLDKTSINRFMVELRRVYKIDILINNSGVNIIEPIDSLNEVNWDRVLKVNLFGPMLLMREVAKIMKRNKSKGKILNISSIFGIVSKAKRSSYSASKAGLIGVTKAAALDLAPFNIFVNALCPGFTMTDLTTFILSKQEIKALESEIPLNRFAQPSEIAKVAIFLCSDLNTYITGQTIVVDGGFTLK